MKLNTKFTADVTVHYRAFGDTQDIRLGTREYDVSDPDNVTLATHEILDDLWRWFNHALPGITGQLAMQYRVRSMSVGDMVTVNGTTYRCATVGWEKGPPQCCERDHNHDDNRDQHPVKG